MKTRNDITLIAVLFFSMVLCSCKNHTEEYHSVTDRIAVESKNYHGISISSNKYHENKEMIEITIGEQTFLIPERKNQIKSYACSECHSKPLNEMNNEVNTKKAHWDISLNHADENTMNCITCHNPKNMDALVSLTKKSVDFNASYKICTQCHTKQAKDWEGGAHGKQLSGWAPPRTSMTCVNCHNPHKPHFESKWPARFNTQIVKERK